MTRPGQRARILAAALAISAGLAACGAPGLAAEAPASAEGRRTVMPAAHDTLAAAERDSAEPPGRGPADTGVLTGESIAVQDGDSFVLRTPDGRRLRIRIAGIDAPEKGQPFADVSRRHLAALLRGRSLQVEVRKLDAFGRHIARVDTVDGDVALAQIEAGLAWHFQRYAADQPPDERLRHAQAQERARAAGAGLWRDPSPEPPWSFRRRAASGARSRTARSRRPPKRSGC